MDARIGQDRVKIEEKDTIPGYYRYDVYRQAIDIDIISIYKSSLSSCSDCSTWPRSAAQCLSLSHSETPGCTAAACRHGTGTNPGEPPTACGRRGGGRSLRAT